MTEAKTPPGEAWPPLPFAETTAWSDSHMGRRWAIVEAPKVNAGGHLPNRTLGASLDAAGAFQRGDEQPFTGHPFCSQMASEFTGCALAAGHSCPCRFTRRLP